MKWGIGMSSKSRFKPKKKQYTIEWPEGHTLHGMEVTLRGMRLGELEAFAGAAVKFEETTGDDNVAAINFMVEKIARVLVGWNRVDEDTVDDDDDESGELLPATAEGLRKLDIEEFMEICKAYMGRMGGVEESLGKGSNNGDMSLVELPMTEQ